MWHTAYTHTHECLHIDFVLNQIEQGEKADDWHDQLNRNQDVHKKGGIGAIEWLLGEGGAPARTVHKLFVHFMEDIFRDLLPFDADHNCHWLLFSRHGIVPSSRSTKWDSCKQCDHWPFGRRNSKSCCVYVYALGQRRHRINSTKSHQLFVELHTNAAGSQRVRLDHKCNEKIGRVRNEYCAFDATAWLGWQRRHQ